MKFLSKGVRAIWHDGSIPKKAKTQFFVQWEEYFSTSTHSRFTDLLNLDAFCIPVEEKYILDKVKELWSYFNPEKDFTVELLMHEKENKPIIKRTELIKNKVELVSYKSRKLTEEDFK